MGKSKKRGEGRENMSKSTSNTQETKQSQESGQKTEKMKENGICFTIITTVAFLVWVAVLAFYGITHTFFDMYTTEIIITAIICSCFITALFIICATVYKIKKMEKTDADNTLNNILEKIKKL